MHLFNNFKQGLLVFLLCFILLPLSVNAQFEYFNSEEFWKRLKMEPATTVPSLHADDTTIIIATNRQTDTSGFRFLPEERAGGIKYYFMYSGKGQWHLIPVISLEKAIAMMPDRNKDWLVYTEGMGKFFTTDADRGMQVSAQYGVNVIMMDYPSITAHKKRLGNYFFAMKNARIAYEDFVPVFDTVKQLRTAGKMGKGSLNVLFHSMGNIVMRQTVKHHLLSLINDQVWVDNLILNAPCVPQYHHRKWVEQIKFARRIYIHYNQHDFTLGGAYLVSKRNQLGMKVKAPLASNAIYINFNTIADKGHSNFVNLYGRDVIPMHAQEHYNVLFHGLAAAIQNTKLYSPSVYRHIGYDLLP